MNGFDSSFFFALESQTERAVQIWRSSIAEADPSAVSSFTVFELLRHGLRGALPRDFVEGIAERAGIAYTQAGVDDVEVLDRAARIAHGTGLPAADSLIAASLEQVGCTRLHTTDTDFEVYEGPMEIVFLDRA